MRSLHFVAIFLMAFALSSAAVPAALQDGPMSTPSPTAINELDPPSGDDRAQVMGNVCRWGLQYCFLSYPMPVGATCFCPGQGWGVVSMQ